MQDTQFTNFILTKSYKTSAEFNNSPKSLLKLINYIKNLPVEQASFDIVYDLLKFYRTPIFIACQPLYERLGKKKEDVGKFEEVLQEIGAYVRNYLENYQLEELKFFYIAGISKKKKKIPEKSEPEIQFLNYIENLGKLINKLKKQIKTINKTQMQLQLDTILAGGLDRKLNTLELNYEQYFKNEADKIYKQFYKKIEDVGQGNESKGNKKALESRPEFEPEKRVPLCCRSFFYDRQVIKEPENLILQYKSYTYPFNQQKIKTLKKTICGFLNTNGGTIFLGIKQDIETKKREVVGMQLNQAQKQNLQFTLRKDIINWIEPDIISNKIYSISFVPVKQSHAPHHYISGRYLTKIAIGYGLRNEIYSYRHDDRDYFAFRTENQVIHREGRDILNAYRERFKNPLPVPVPVHEGPCVLPEEGRPIIGDRGWRKDQPFVYNSNPMQNAYPKPYPYPNPSPSNYNNNYSRPFNKNFSSNNNFNSNNFNNNNFGNNAGDSGKIEYFDTNEVSPDRQKQKQKQKRRYKQKDAMDFIIMGISQKDLLKQFSIENTQRQLTIWSGQGRKKICFLKLLTRQIQNKTVQKLSKMESQNTCQFFQPQRGVEILEGSLKEMQQSLSDFGFKFNVNPKRNALEFKSTEEAVEVFLNLKEMKMKVSFCSV